MPADHAIRYALIPPRLYGLVLAGLLSAVGSTPAHAQVIRCTDPVSGRVTYTDGKCASGTRADEIEARRSPQDILEERERAAQARELSRERIQQSAERRQQNEERRLREQERLQAERQDPANSQECAQARHDLQGVQDTLGRGMYDEATRLDAAQRRAEQACLTPDQWVQAQRERNLNAASGNAPYPYVVQPPVVIRPPLRPTPTPKPPVFTHCNVFRCTDAAGNIYPR